MVRQYAGNWRATKLWADKEYLTKEVGTNVVHLKAFTKHPWSIREKNGSKKDNKEAEKADDSLLWGKFKKDGLLQNK